MAKKNAKPWLEDVEGDEVPQIIECDTDIVVVEANPPRNREDLWFGPASATHSPSRWS